MIKAREGSLRGHRLGHITEVADEDANADSLLKATRVGERYKTEGILRKKPELVRVSYFCDKFNQVLGMSNIYVISLFNDAYSDLFQRMISTLCKYHYNHGKNSQILNFW